MLWRQKQRPLAVVLLVCFIAVFLGGTLLIPWSAQALAPVAETGPVGTAILGREIKLEFGNALLASLITGLVSATTSVAQKFAYDLAVGLASGAKGQNPLAFLKQPEVYFKDLGFQGAGEVISELAKPWEALGLNLCSPRLPEVGLSIALGIAERFQPKPPKCDFATTIQNWKNLASTYQNDPYKLLANFSLSFNPSYSDLGQAFKLQEAVRIKIEAKKFAGFTGQLVGGGILPKSSLISGDVETPAEVIRQNFRDLAQLGKETQKPPTAWEVANTVGGPEVWAAIVPTIASTFVNTLSSRLLKMALEGLFKPKLPEALPNLLDLYAGKRPGEQVARASLAVGLFTPQIRTSTAAYDFLSELGACPTNRAAASQFNCTIDQSFMVAIQRAATGAPVTVQEAVDELKLLDRQKSFGFSDPSSDPPREPDYTEGYPYSSFKKLRLLRVLPLGWEFAALKIQELGVPKTLGEVLDGFSVTGPDGQCSTGDAQESPFCGLVDPHWILKAPVASCGARVFGALLDNTGTGRQEVCADLKHCLAQDELGNCTAWGSCTRERNVWRIDGETCASQYASCETFKGGGSESAARTLSVLENTLQFGVCNHENAGCAAYRLVQDRTGSWAASPVRFLDRDAESCTSNSEGCTEFLASPGLQIPGVDPGAPAAYPEEVQKVYFRASPEELGCKGEVSDAPDCARFSRPCRKEEVGCERFTPADGAPPISALASAQDTCPQTCVSYSAFLKQPSAFEPVFENEQPYLFIAQKAQLCSAVEAGCEEFTNLQTEAREYYSALRPCQKPGQDSATYFTWEGAERTGYVLKSWQLKHSQSGSLPSDRLVAGSGGTPRPPCTNWRLQVQDGATTTLCEDDAPGHPQAVCDPTSAEDNPDCRVFYDAQGNAFARWLSKSLASSPECTLYRWTGLTALPEVPGQTRSALEQVACAQGGGVWENTNSQCLYLALPAQSRSCRAQENGCRAFAGGRSGNVEIVRTDLFESGLQGWEGGTLSSEALKVGGHSLKITQEAGREVTVRPGAAYHLSLLAKGVAGGELQAFLQVGETSFVLGQARLTPEWQTFNFGPVVSPAGDFSTAKLALRRDALFYVDTITLKQIPELVYAVKNSWQIPSECDALPAALGGGRVRAAMLGCARYTDRANHPYYLRAFSRLCREEAVGCRDLIDTRNSVTPAAQQFNVDGALEDDVTVPADRHRFLVADPRFACTVQDRGCRALGQNTTAEQIEKVYLKDDPEKYARTLCRAEAQRCGEWTRSSGGMAYFKDPGVGGCEWKTGVMLGGVSYSGWFKLGINEPCYGVVRDDAVEAAQTYLIGGTTFGIYRNGDPQYAGQVGFCPAQQATCTELVDRLNPENPQPYYVKENEHLQTALRACGTTASLEQGCALFDKTEELTKKWNSSRSYDAGVVTAGAPQDPDLKKRNNEANVVLKVLRDRQCSQWLSCASASWVWDANAPGGPKFRTVCNTLARCEGLSSATSPGDPATQCASWSETLQPQLTYATYLDREKGWAGQEYSGYSLANLYAPESLIHLPVSGTSRLVKSLGFCENGAPGSACEALRGGLAGQCWSGHCVVNPDGTPVVGANAPARSQVGFSCRGYPERDSPFPNFGNNPPQAFAQVTQCNQDNDNLMACDCSYTKYVFGSAATRYAAYTNPALFRNAPQVPNGLCQGSVGVEGRPCQDNRDCQITAPGENGQEEIIESGTCVKRTKDLKFLGWQGFCLEQDQSRTINGSPETYPCLTWLPVDQLSGAPDVYNQYVQAGYVPPGNAGRYYCLEGGNAQEREGFIQMVVPAAGIPIAEAEGLFNPPRYGDAPVVRHNDSAELEDWVNTQWSRKTVNITDADRQINQDDLDTLIIEGTTVQDSEDPPSNARFEIPADGTPGLIEWTSHGRAIVGRYLGRPYQLVLFYGGNAKDLVTPEGQVCYPLNTCSDIKGDIRGLNLAPENRFAIDNVVVQENSEGLWNYDPSIRGKFCRGHSTGHNWHALRLRFHPTTRRFEGYDTLYCDDSTDGGDVAGAIRYKITFKFKGLCTRIAEVASPQNSGWTNRLWLPGYRLSELFYTQGTTASPFGSLLRVNSPGLEPIFLAPTLSPVCGQVAGQGGIRCQYENRPLTYTPGAPYACPASQCLRSELGRQVQPVEEVRQSVATDGLRRLSTLFTRSNFLWQWNREQSSYVRQDGVPPNFDQRLHPFGDERFGTPPKIAAAGACLPNNQGCAEAPGAFTLTDNIGDHQQGQLRGFNGTLRTVMKFYAYADANQMPLRGIAIDWGEQEETPQLGSGYYKNHRGLVDGQAQCVPESDAPDFGHIKDRTCDQAYFQYEHTYQCAGKTAAQVDPNWQEGARCPVSDFANRFGGCCVFKPRVMVQDNWAWCTGHCLDTDGNGTSDGCFDPTANFLQQDFFGHQACDPTRRWPAGQGPWVEFPGEVVVAPKR